MTFAPVFQAGFMSQGVVPAGTYYWNADTGEGKERDAEDLLFVAGNSAEVYRSTDEGVSWTSLGTFHTASDVESGMEHMGCTFLVRPSADKAIVSFRRQSNGRPYVSISDDGGDNWSIVEVDTVTLVNSDALPALFALDENTVVIAYATTSAMHFKKSTDGGATWGSRITVTSESSITTPHLAVLNEDVMLCGYTVSDGTQKVAQSTDGGATWGTPVTIASHSGQLAGIRYLTASAVVAVMGGIGAGIGNADSYYSSDGGATWTNSAGPVSGDAGRDVRLDVLSATAASAFRGEQSLIAIYSTGDAGDNWTQRYSDTDDVIAGQVLVISATKVLVFAGDASEFRRYVSTDAGINWSGAVISGFTPSVSEAGVNVAAPPK